MGEKPAAALSATVYHMDLDPSLRDNLWLRYYFTGHMGYLNPHSQKAFRADLVPFHGSAAP